MKRLCLLLLALGIACTPDIPRDPPPPPAVVALFDPGATIPVVPTPSDLAKDPTTGRIVVPSSDATPAAQVEFNRDYLGNLTGFPFESTAEVLLSGALDPKTVSTDTVVVLDLTDNGTPVANVTPVYDDKKPSITVPPPAGGGRVRTNTRSRSSAARARTAFADAAVRT